MGVSYKRLWKILVERDISRADLRKQLKISPNTMTKLFKNEYVAMPILNKICENLEVDYGEIIQYIPDKEDKNNGI